MTAVAPPAAATLDLRAGPLSLRFERGAAREVRLGELVILRGVYAAVRDRDWATVPPVYSDLRLERDERSFALSVRADYTLGDIDFRARIALTGDADGRLTSTFSGRARSNFLRNRIGLCVLHPAGAAGAACEVVRADGTRVVTRFPEEITAAQPVAPFFDLGQLIHEFAPGAFARVTFEGDLFETEDQRNWTDASFKTFCTPLRLPFPVEVKAGEAVEQRVVLELAGALPVAARKRRAKSVTATLPARGAPLPALGVGSSRGAPRAAFQMDRLRALNLSHLRLEARFSGLDALEALREGVWQAHVLGLPLELAVFFSGELERDLARLEQELDTVPVARVLVFGRGERVTPPELFHAVRPGLTRLFPDAQVGAGTDSDFFFLNRDRPVLKTSVLAAFALHPQTHAFDDLSLIETLEVQPLVARQAAGLLGAPVAVSPLTLAACFNPYATGPQTQAEADARQRTAFGAAWTLGSLAALIGSGALHSVSLFETAGPRGLMEHAGSDGLFPVYHLLEAFADFKGGEAAALSVSDPSKAGGVVLRSAKGTRVLVANFTPKTLRLDVQNWPGARLTLAPHEVLRLDGVPDKEGS